MGFLFNHRFISERNKNILRFTLRKKKLICGAAAVQQERGPRKAKMRFDSNAERPEKVTSENSSGFEPLRHPSGHLPKHNLPSTEWGAFTRVSRKHPSLESAVGS